MSSHQNKSPISLFLYRRSTFLVYFQRSSILHHLSLLVTSWLPHWCPAWILLLLGKYKPLSLHLSMWLIRLHFRFLLLVFILVILIMYFYEDHCYRIYLILGNLHVHTRPCLLLLYFFLLFRPLCSHSMLTVGWWNSNPRIEAIWILYSVHLVC